MGSEQEFYLLHSNNCMGFFCRDAFYIEGSVETDTNDEIKADNQMMKHANGNKKK